MGGYAISQKECIAACQQGEVKLGVISQRRAGKYYRKPMITGEEGRITVEIFTAIYRSQRDRDPVRFPVEAEIDQGDFDSRQFAS